MSEHNYGVGKVKMTRISLKGLRGLVIENVPDEHELGSVEPGWEEGDKKHLDGSETVLWFGCNVLGGVKALQAELALLVESIKKGAPNG